MAEQDRLTLLYEWSEAMSKAGDAVKEKHEEDYKKLIEFAKTSENSKERIMAAQLVARFFKFFPELQDLAFDSIVDLCESPDVDVRKHAAMAMITTCRTCKNVVSKAADILIQLYQTNQPSEVNLINQSLATLLDLNVEQFLKSFFANFEDGSEPVRERSLKFLASKIHTVAPSSLTKEVEEQLMAYTKEAMEDVTKEEFISFIGILSKLKIAKTSSGQATLVAAIKTQAEMSKEFDVADKEFLDKFLLCTKHTIPFLSQYNRASEYVNYICLRMLPRLAELAAIGQDLNILQTLAEISPHIIIEDAPNLINLDECHKVVYSKLIEYLPDPSVETTPAPSQPPTDADQKEVKTTELNAGESAQDAKPAESEVQTPTDKADQATEAAQPADPVSPNTITTTTTTTTAAAAASKPVAQEADFQFTHIEYLMYTFVQLSRLKPELYTEAMQVESRKKFSRLANGCRKYTDALERQLTSVKRNDLNKEENKLRGIALRTTKNISTIILGLFKKPADYRTSITLSCKPVRIESTPPAGANGNANSAKNNNHNNNNTSSNSTNKAQVKPKHGGVYVGPNQRANASGGNQRTGSGGYNNNNQRQVGQKSKYRGNYQADNRGKRPRHAK